MATPCGKWRRGSGPDAADRAFSIREPAADCKTTPRCLNPFGMWVSRFIKGVSRVSPFVHGIIRQWVTGRAENFCGHRSHTLFAAPPVPAVPASVISIYDGEIKVDARPWCVSKSGVWKMLTIKELQRGGTFGGPKEFQRVTLGGSPTLLLTAALIWIGATSLTPTDAALRANGDTPIPEPVAKLLRIIFDQYKEK